MSAPEAALLAPSRVPTLPVALVGLGSCLPATVIGNEQIAARTGVDTDWIERRTGIRTRRHSGPDDNLLDLAAEAAREALADADVSATDLDLVLVASVSQGRPMPALAPQVAHAIGAGEAGAFDLGAACSGFVMALATGCSFIEAGRAQRVIVVAADQLSRQVDPSDRRTAALFGDGAAAAVLGVGAGDTRWTMALGSDGSACELIANDRESGMICMQGHDTFIQAVRRMEQATITVCDSAGAGLEDIDLFVFHQANARITKTLAKRLAVPAERVVDCIEELGNTSAASVPLALEQARGEGRLNPGDRVLLAAVGSGLVWGAILLDWRAS